MAATVGRLDGELDPMKRSIHLRWTTPTKGWLTALSVISQCLGIALDYFSRRTGGVWRLNVTNSSRDIWKQA